MLSSLRSRFGARLAQTGLTFALGIGLTSALWFATLPVATAAVMSPTELIESGLPPGVMVKTAGKPQFLTAVCAAVKSNPTAAASITKAAVTAHHEYAGDIVATAIRCASGEEIDCDVTGAIVAAAIVAWPQSAAVIDDAALATAPDCADSVQTRTERSDGKQVLDGKEMLGDKEVIDDIPEEGPGFTAPNAPPFFVGGGGGGFNPEDRFVQVCDNGQERRIRASRLRNFLNNHPSASAGTCPVVGVTTLSVCDNGRQRLIQSDRLKDFLAAHPGAFEGTCQVTPSTSR